MPDPKRKKFWQFPVKSPFGATDTALRGKNPDGSNRKHTGVDYGTPIGTPITPFFAGDVLKVVKNDQYLGNYVVVLHADGSMSKYGHLAQIRVHIGDAVDEETVIGLSGRTGRVTGPHLHFELSDETGIAVNPTGIFPSGPAADGEVDLSKDVPSKMKAEDRLASLGAFGRGEDTSLYPDIPGEGKESTGLFSRPLETGSGADILNQAPSFLTQVGRDESKYTLPIFDPSRGGTGAFAENVIRGLGIAPGRGNPYADQLEQETERLALPTAFARLIRGEHADLRSVADQVVESLRGGTRNPITSQQLREAYANIPTESSDQTMQQEVLAAIARDNPKMLHTLIGNMMNLPPDLARLIPGILQQRQRSATRASGGVPNAALTEFLIGGGE